VSDISLTWSALSLPVLEPLTPEKLEKLCVLTMSCLYCAVSNATASSLLGISSAISPKCTGTASGKPGLKSSVLKTCNRIEEFCS
jgi:E3 ubiquitin-protein ligase UBR4